MTPQFYRMSDRPDAESKAAIAITRLMEIIRSPFVKKSTRCRGAERGPAPDIRKVRAVL